MAQPQYIVVVRSDPSSAVFIYVSPMKHLFSIKTGRLCQNNGIQLISDATRYGCGVKMENIIMWGNTKMVG